MLVMVMVLTQCNVLLEDDELNIYSDDRRGNDGDGNGVGDDDGGCNHGGGDSDEHDRPNCAVLVGLCEKS